MQNKTFSTKARKEQEAERDESDFCTVSPVLIEHKLRSYYRSMLSLSIDSYFNSINRSDYNIKLILDNINHYFKMYLRYSKE